MAKHNKSQGQGNNKPKRKRDRFLDLFKFNLQGSRSPTLSSASSAGIGTNVEGMTEGNISDLAYGPGGMLIVVYDHDPKIDFLHLFLCRHFVSCFWYDLFLRS
ncbi:hypothetical protein GYMLUDRAFT_927495 [Collybiopsis luxurians FD-317 M1]|uniref:Uncharacterized protein n=1 Tax=Collybiopsis luxurians FD-317 M1 TaxID=944289 RepID=A0A0D0C6W3_9AGAR|nr:hypothetical protein GYMLUDRAFT_927495 [Collybiopsis luxurians FD-317 M1]